MGITGLIPFLEKASRRANVDEFSGCTVAVDSYCWLHKGAFACANKLVRGEVTDVHIRYCLKYVTMLLSKNIKPILVFDGRHLPAKALTEAKRRESRNASKKRAAELLSLGQIEEARSFIRRSVDITHAMALALIKECRKRNVDCIVAPYEADAQLAYLNMKNIAHVVITEDSDLILFGCNKVLFKMDLDGMGTLVETVKLPLVMRCPVDRYCFDKFRQMCIMSGCDYLPSLPGIGLAKARQFVCATQDANFANALRKLPSFFNKSSLVVTDEYRESFLKAEATFKHQYVYDPIERRMTRLTELEDEDVEVLCSNAGEPLEASTAFQLALGNLDPFTLKKMDDWHPDRRDSNINKKTDGWSEKQAKHASIWCQSFKTYLDEARPWLKKVEKAEPIISTKTRAVKKVVNLVSKYVPETQNETLTIDSLSSMYCVNQVKEKTVSITESQEIQSHERVMTEEEILREMTTQKEKSPILENKDRSFKKRTSYSVMKRLSKFPRTEMSSEVVESKFFSQPTDDTIEISPPKSRNPFKVQSPDLANRSDGDSGIDSIENRIESLDNRLDTQCVEMIDSLNSSQKENSPVKSEVSPVSKNPFKMTVPTELRNASEDSVIDNTYPVELTDSQSSLPPFTPPWRDTKDIKRSNASQPVKHVSAFKSNCRVPGLKRTQSLPANQPTLLSKFGFQKKPVMKR